MTPRVSLQGMLERVGEYIHHHNFCDGRNLAKGRSTTAGSVYKDHTTGEAVDGVLTKETCYWSDYGNGHWWSMDLSQDFAIGKIRIISIVSQIVLPTHYCFTGLNIIGVYLSTSI